MGKVGSFFFNYEKSAFTAAAPIFFVLFGFLGSVVFWGNFTMDQGPLDTYREFGVPVTGVVAKSVAEADAADGAVRGDGSDSTGDYLQWPYLYVKLDQPPAADRNDPIGVTVNTRTGSRLRSGDHITVLRSYSKPYSSYDYILPGDKPPLRRHLEFLFAVLVLPFVIVEIFWLTVATVHARRGFAISPRLGWRRMRSIGWSFLFGIGYVVYILAEAWAAFSSTGGA